jgi:Fe(3+) dicitrate transport protein
MANLLTILFVCASTFLFGQSKGDITLIFKDNRTKTEISFIKLELVEINKPFIADLTGDVSITNLNYGRYTVKLDSHFYTPYNFNFEVKKATQTVRFKTTNKIKQLEVIEVVEDGGNGSIRKMRSIEGVLISQGKKTEVITVDKIAGNKAVGLGRQIYSRIPGLNIWESDGAGIQLGIGGRGLSPTRTSNYNTRQNGYDISADALGYPESYYTPPTEAIDEIQLIRGASSLQFGPQFGGLINFKLKKGAKNKKIEVVVRHTAGSFGLNSSFLSVGGSTPTFNYYGYYQYKFGNDWRPNSKFNVHAGGIYLYKYFNEKFKISLDLTKQYYLTQQAGGLTDLQFSQDPTQSNRDRNWFEVDWNLAAVQFDYEFNSRTKINSRFFGLLASRKALGFLGQITRVDHLEERDLISGQFKNFGNETRFLNVYNFKKQTWAYVVGFRYYKGYNKGEQGLASDTDLPEFEYNNPQHLEGSSYEFPSQNISLFAEHIFNINSKFSVTPGVRFEHIKTTADGSYRTQIEDLAGNVIFDSTYLDQKENQRSFIITGLGGMYKVNDSLEFYANVSQNYRSINFTDMQIQNPNFKIDPNLEDEKGYNSDLGFRGGIKNKITYDVSLFGLYYSNRIGTTIETDSILYSTYQYRTNISASLTTGIEAMAELNIWKWFISDSSDFDLSYFINASYVNSKYIKSKEPAYENKNVELVPPFNLKTGFTFGYKNLSTSLQYSYTEQHFSDATNSIQQANAVNGLIPTYQVFDFSLKYRYKWFTVESGVNNLTNSSYFTRRATGYPGPGIIPSSPRNYYLTLQLKL